MLDFTSDTSVEFWRREHRIYVYDRRSMEEVFKSDFQPSTGVKT